MENNLNKQENEFIASPFDAHDQFFESIHPTIKLTFSIFRTLFGYLHPISKLSLAVTKCVYPIYKYLVTGQSFMTFKWICDYICIDIFLDFFNIYLSIFNEYAKPSLINRIVFICYVFIPFLYFCLYLINKKYVFKNSNIKDSSFGLHKKIMIVPLLFLLTVFSDRIIRHWDLFNLSDRSLLIIPDILKITTSIYMLFVCDELEKSLKFK